MEFDGGLNSSVGPFNNAWLGGLTYSGHNGNYSKTWSLSAMYKLIPSTTNSAGRPDNHNFQITGVWNINFANGWCDFNGFGDFWREARPWQNTEFIFIAEPQLWLNLNKIPGWDKITLSIGGEVELSYNFIGRGWSVMPALGLRWNFS